MWSSSTLRRTRGRRWGGAVRRDSACHAGVADSLRAEVNRDGVRVLTLHVGRTATELQERIFARENRPYTPESLIQPEDVADIVVCAITLPRRAQVTTLTISTE